MSIGNCCRTLVGLPARGFYFLMTVGTTREYVETVENVSFLNGVGRPWSYEERRTPLPVEGTLEELRPILPPTLLTGTPPAEMDNATRNELDAEDAILRNAGMPVIRYGGSYVNRRDVRNYGRCGEECRLTAITFIAVAVLALSAYGASKLAG